MRKPMKTLLITFTLLLINFTIFGRVYNGPLNVELPTGVSIKGKATYEYDIINNIEVKNGSFKFIFSERNSQITAVGAYKKNKKHGIWTYNVIVKGVKINTYTANFSNGRRHGKINSKFVNDGVNLFGSAVFKNDTLIGQVNINSSSQGYTSKANLDNKGYILSFEQRMQQNLTVWNIYRSVVLTNQGDDISDQIFRELGQERIKKIIDSALMSNNNLKVDGYFLEPQQASFEQIDIMALFSTFGFYEIIKDDFNKEENEGLLYNDGDTKFYYPQTAGMNYYVLRKLEPIK